MAHHENMRVKAGDFNSAITKSKDDPYGFALPKAGGGGRIVFGEAALLSSLTSKVPHSFGLRGCRGGGPDAVR